MLLFCENLFSRGKRSIMKRIITTIALFSLLLASFAITGCGSKGLSKKEFTIATGSKSGVYYPIGETLAKILKENHPDITLKVLETNGSVENLGLVKEGKVDLALVQNDIAFYASHGEKMFKDQKISCISGIATLFPEVVQLIVRKDANINSLNDLAGKKIAVGSQNSGTYHNAQQILSLAQVWDKIDQQHINGGEAMKAFEAGEIQGFIFTSGIPNPAIAALAEKVELSMLPIDPEMVQKLVNQYDFYFPSTIPGNQYKGQSTEISAVEINAILVSNDKMAENDQYLLTKTLFGQPNELGKSHPRLSKMTKNSLRRQLPVNVGKGAYKAHSEMK